MGRTFYIRNNPLSKRVDNMNDAVAGMEMAMGLTETHKRNARGVLDTLRAGRSAEVEAGARANGNDYQVDHVESNGDTREVHMMRKNESGHWEKRVAVEERVGDGTFITKELRYAR